LEQNGIKKRPCFAKKDLTQLIFLGMSGLDLNVYVSV
jgi:hypothetical protein